MIIYWIISGPDLTGGIIVGKSGIHGVSNRKRINLIRGKTNIETNKKETIIIMKSLTPLKNQI